MNPENGIYVMGREPIFYDLGNFEIFVGLSQNSGSLVGSAVESDNLRGLY